MKREHSYLTALSILMCFALWSCVSTLTWKIEPLEKRTEIVQKTEAKKDTIPVKKSNYQKQKEAFKKDFDPLFDRLPPAYK